MTGWTWQTGSVISSGEGIYWELSGEHGEVVVLTHGAGGSHAVWFQQVPELVAAGYRVLTWDSRGFGNSTFRSGSLGAVEAAADLGVVLDNLDSLGLLNADDPVHLVGQSMGGWYVTEFAIANPDRIRSLALCDTIGSVYTDELRQVLADFRARGGLGGGGAPRGGTLLAASEADETTAFLYQQLGTFHSPPLEEVGRVLAGAEHAPSEVSALGVPVLVLAGDRDPIFPPGPLKNMASLISGSTWVEIADAGHSPYFEQPAAFNAALLTFLGSATPGSAALGPDTD
jgi:3-oxoadipate enol-lactonase